MQEHEEKPPKATISEYQATFYIGHHALVHAFGHGHPAGLYHQRFLSRAWILRQRVLQLFGPLEIVLANWLTIAGSGWEYCWQIKGKNPVINNAISDLSETLERLGNDRVGGS